MRNLRELFRTKSQCVWLARNEDGSLNVFKSRPTRHLKGEEFINRNYVFPVNEGVLESGEWKGDLLETIPSELYPELTWASAPCAAIRATSFIR